MHLRQLFEKIQVLAATQTPGESGKRWFQGTADAVRQFHWLFEVEIRLKLAYHHINRQAVQHSFHRMQEART
jgi:ADP-glucose pyrophosphorylase